MSQPGLPKHRPPDAEAVESSPGTDQGDKPKKGRERKGDKQPVREMKLTVDIQQWLRKEDRKAVKMKLTDLKNDKTKKPGQIGAINHDNVAKKVAGYQALPPARPLCVTAWEDSGMTSLAFLHNIDNLSSLCCAVVHDLRCGWLALRS